ncbi:leucine zipper transcription factor-like protein 1 [Ctenodactylus gundi]
MRFARSKRGLRLKTVDSCFQDLTESRLVEETFTVDEVSEVLRGLQAVVHSEVESELIHTAHTNVLLLRQLFSQAEKWYLKLQTDISELENRELLEQVAEFEKAEFTSSNKKPMIDVIKPKLVPLNEGGTTELLNKEILRLQEENEKLRSRLKSVEMQAMSALDEKSQLERSLQELQLHQESQKDLLKGQDLSDLENTVAALKSELQKTRSEQTGSQKSLEESLAAAKHDLLRVQGQLSLAEKELESRFQQTAAYRNLKGILARKNELIKELRGRLASYALEAPALLHQGAQTQHEGAPAPAPRACSTPPVSHLDRPRRSTTHTDHRDHQAQRSKVLGADRTFHPVATDGDQAKALKAPGLHRPLFNLLGPTQKHRLLPGSAFVPGEAKVSASFASLPSEEGCDKSLRLFSPSSRNRLKEK